VNAFEFVFPFIIYKTLEYNKSKV